MHSSSHRLGTPAINRASAWRMLTFKNSSALGTAFPSPGEFLEWERDHLWGFGPAAAHPESLGQGQRGGCHAGAVPQAASRWRRGHRLGGQRSSRRPQPVAGPCSPTTWSWELAVGSGLAAGGWGRTVGLVWGFSLPGGPSWLCAEQTFRPDVANMRNQFSGNSAAKPSTFGREAGSLSALGAQCLPLENQRGLFMVGARPAWLGGGGGVREACNAESEASSQLISTGLGSHSWGSTSSFVFL